MMFASKGPAEPRREYLECRHGDVPQDDGLDSCVICRAVWIEHPHVQHNEPNPILVDCRWSHAAPDRWAEYALTYLGPHEHIVHARKVLTRLAAFDA